VQTLDNLPVPPSRRGQVIVYALERWQTLAVVLVACLGMAATVVFMDASLLLLAVFAAFAVLGVGAMVVVSFRDDASLDEALLTKADLGELRDKLLREKVARAEAYQLAIRQAVRAARSPTVRGSLEMITRELADPVALVFSLAKRLDQYQRDQIIQQDLRRLSSGRALNDAERTQLESLQKLQRLMGETGQAIDSALAQLGSSYTAIQLAQSASELKGTTASAVQAELRQQSEQLRDLNSSLDEVYAERLRGGI
jgi:hypothetical protein